ncbi:MAG: phenylacetate--CoA ligase family protein, partial [Eubacteriales bacterium]|nr:phenylacetate--CoA ligase family protein [Eubacteriales bacterium]
MNYPQLLLRFFGLRGNVKKTKTEISRMQNEKLRTLLRYAWRNSTYYRRRFMEAGITEEQLATLPLCSFPTTDKAELLTHFDELVTVPELQQEALRRFDVAEGERQAAYLGKYHLVHTSGSTGKPSYFVYDEAAWSEMLLAIIRGALWNMSAFAIIKLLLRGPRIAYLAATDGRYGGALAVTDGVSGLRAKQLSLDIKTPLSEWVDRMRAFQPNIVIGYPSAIKILGELVEE